MVGFISNPFMANPAGAFQTGQSNALQIAAQKHALEQSQKQAQQSELERQLMAQAMGQAAPTPNQAAPQAGGSDAALAQLFVQNPDLHDKVFARMGTMDKAKRDEAANFAHRISGMSQERQDDHLAKRVADLESQGRDATQTRELLSLPYEERLEDLKVLQMAGLSNKDRIDIAENRKQIADAYAYKDKVRAEDRDYQAQAAAQNASVQAQGLPPALTKGMSAEQAEQASAIYGAAGGGKEGLKAIKEQMGSVGNMSDKRSYPKMIEENFPEATRKEKRNILAAMKTAKDASSAFEKGTELREKQIKATKGLAYTIRAKSLVERIIKNKELDDVVGPIEGKMNLIQSGAESDAIADIEEVRNILTADNLDLMSGVLSETDIQLLANMSSGRLTRDRTEATFMEDAKGLLNEINQTINAVNRARGTSEPPMIPDDDPAPVAGPIDLGGGYTVVEE